MKPSDFQKKLDIIEQDLGKLLKAPLGPCNFKYKKY